MSCFISPVGARVRNLSTICTYSDMGVHNSFDKANTCTDTKYMLFVCICHPCKITHGTSLEYNSLKEVDLGLRA